jgi:hypothetical protein
LLRRDDERAARCVAGRAEPLDTFLDFVVAHRLSVTVLAALAGSALRSAFSADRIAALERAREAQRTRSRLLLEELERVADRFQRAGQRFLLLKGLYHATRFCGGLDGREFVDLDQLVPRGDRARAFRLLAEAGYRHKSGTFGGVGLTCFFVHGFDFANGRAKIDLHWTLSRHPSFRIDEEALWQQRQSYPVNGRSYDVLSDEDDLMLALLSLLRDIERGGGKIRNVVDLLRMAEAFDADVDWDAFWAARREEGTLGPALNVLALCVDLAAVPCPRLRSALAQLDGRRVRPALTPSPLLFAPTRFGLGNKLWSARVHDTAFPVWLLWWGASLPFRIAVHGRKRPWHRRRSRAKSQLRQAV